MSGLSPSPFQRRLAAKLEKATFKGRFTQDDIRLIQRAFVEALKEEVEARYGQLTALELHQERNRQVPLVIAGLGSFKMKARPGGLQFRVPGQPGFTAPSKPARRLVFASKWEPLP